MSLKNWLIISLTYATTALGAWSSSYIQSDFNLTTLSAESSEDYQNYQQYSTRFPSDDNGLSISIKSNAKFNSLAAFTKLEELRKDLLNIKGVESALSITSVELAQKTLLGSTSKLILPLDENLFEKRFASIDAYSDVSPKFVSKDRTATRIMLKVDWQQIDLSQIHKALNRYEFTETHLMGKGVFTGEMKTSVEHEIVWLPLIAGAILLFLFFLWFRDWRSLIVVASILALNSALLSIVFYFTGIKIGILTSTTPLLILVLSFSDIVHILYKFKSSKTEFIPERIRETMQPLQLPLWLTTLTTGVAFALFFFTGIGEIWEFAFVTCSGILLAYLTARFVLPVFLHFYQVRVFSRRSAFSSSAELLIQFLKKRRIVLSITLGILVLISISVITHFQINTSYHERFGKDSKIGQAFRFSDEYFEGTRAIDVVLESKNGLTNETVAIVDQIEKALTKDYGCRAIFSVNMSIKRLNRYNRFGKPSQFKLPNEIDDKFVADLVEYKNELGLTNAMTDDQQLFRIVGRLPDIGSAEAAKRNERLQSKLNELEDKNHRLFMSGFSFVGDQSSTRVTKFVLIGIALSLIVAMMVIGLIFRSFRIALIAFIPNVLPVGFGLALMFSTGIQLNPTTAMALSIILGLALDDTIYFLSSIKRNTHLPLDQSIQLSLRENTFPAAVTSIILIIGFGILMLSSVESNRNIGLLVATMLFIALISDLIILPALLKTIGKNNLT